MACSVSDSPPPGLLLLDESGSVLFCNAEARQILTYADDGTKKTAAKALRALVA